jgi:hypothetical protein
MLGKSILAGVLVLGMAGCASVGRQAEPDIAAQVAAAHSADDHRRLADHFAGKAAEYDAEAARHDKLSRSYMGPPKALPGAMASHCRALRDQFAAAAKTARGLAHEHRSHADSMR